MNKITFNDVPTAMQELLERQKRLEGLLVRFLETNENPQPKFITMKKAEEITGRSANALRMQVHLGNLKSIKKDGKHVFDREYLERWMSGDLV